MSGKDYRHGDITLHAITKKEFEEEARCHKDRLKKSDKIVLALGEVSGHKHVLVAEKPGAIEFVTLGDEVYMHVTARSVITHEEHRQLTIVPGFYVKKTERDFNPFTQSIQEVRD